MRVGESVKKGFSTAVGSLNLILIILGISVAFNLAMSPLSKNLQSMTAEWGNTPTFAQVLPALPFISIFIVLTTLLNAAITAGSFGFISHKIKNGSAPIAVFFSSSAKLFLRFLGLVLSTFLFGLVFFVAIIVSIFIAALISSIGGNAGIWLGIGVSIGILLILALVGFGVYWMFLLFTLAPYEMTAQGTPVIASIKAGARVAKANFWPLVWIVTILSAIFLIFAGIVFIVGFIVASATGDAAALQSSGPLSMALSVVFGFLFLFVDFFSKSSLMNFYLGVNSGTPR